MNQVAKLESFGQHALFEAQTSPMALLDPDLRIRGANSAYLSATASVADQLMTRVIFDAFPDNPATPEAHSVENLQASLDSTLRTGRPDHMALQRYDVPDRSQPGTFITKVWAPVNAPIRDGDEIIGILHRVDEVTTLPGEVLESLRGPAAPGRPADHQPESARLAAVIAHCLRAPGRPHPVAAGDLAESGWPGEAEGLSRRESEVVARIVQGLTNHEIAAEMYLSINSIKTYVRGAYKKMGVERRPQAMRWALAHGFELERPAPPRRAGDDDGA
jgi:DNA-binding CsgD family transcriptional regulator